MCGITGSYSHAENIAVDVDALHQISASMQARGPDGAGFWQHHNQSIALAHRRLAVIDLSTGAAQPMHDVSNRYVISFNGEIYNYQSLRLDCERKGYQFITQSDTEVILALYHFYHSEMLSKLRGMFAFAICDKDEQSILLARDPHGIKPLYYVDHSIDDVPQCTFASSLRALHKTELIDSQQLNKQAISGFQHLGSVPEPITWFQQAKLLPAGSYRLLTREKKVKESSEVQQYWNLSFYSLSNRQQKIESGHHNIIRKAVTESVKYHMVADVPVGLFLSAGIDSSVLATLMRQCSDQSITAITLRFAEYQDTIDDESIIAAEIAQRHGLEHHVYTLGREEFLQELPHFFASMEQPTIDGLNTWFVAKAAKKLGLKVVMSGVGGDELFGGYPSFSSIPKLLLVWPFLSMFFKIPFAKGLFHKVLNFLRLKNQHKWSSLMNFTGSIIDAYRLQRAILLHSELDLESQIALTQLEKKLDLNEVIIKNASARRNVSFLESQCYLRNQLLRDADWTSMAHSIEIRTPFVDSQLSETLANIPDDVLYQESKSSLAALLSPDDYELLAQRPKTGFTIPMQEWLSQLEREKSRDNFHWSRIYLKHVMARFSEYHTKHE